MSECRMYIRKTGIKKITWDHIFGAARKSLNIAMELFITLRLRSSRLVKGVNSRKRDCR